ncbi:ICOS ligand [Mauremys reevesii]|uniref:ICOS ligand n=1 Tax=Mauremys reevesii TaxID=260615 RepID=UPI00193ECE35|nr:ICOS ligand [Mauremys reevesii]
MEPRSSGLWLLFLCTLGCVTAEEDKKVISTIGSTAELSCIYPQEKKFILNKLRVFWQIGDGSKPCSVVHTFNSGHENQSEQCAVFRNRTRLFQDELENGIFSLLLLNVSLRDEHTYRCIVQKKDVVFRVIHNADVALKVAANNSLPVLSKPTGNHPNIGEEVTLSCSYSQGYPEPNIYWINRTDNSSLHPSSLKITQDNDGTYSVFSTLKIEANSDIKVGCIIENELLQQNLTVLYSKDVTNPNSTSSGLSDLNKPGAQAGSVLAIAIVLAGLAVLTCWLWKRKSPHRKSYADVQQDEDGAQHNTHV